MISIRESQEKYVLTICKPFVSKFCWKSLWNKSLTRTKDRNVQLRINRMQDRRKRLPAPLAEEPERRVFDIY
ncbi:MAG: hypothetical protein DDT34_02506 [Firmicutes bacterium]|nr:hypothetical protein [Bacillota bacterium]